MYVLGIDIGSSSIKAAVVDTSTGKALARTQSPAVEMGMIALQDGWAEQHPQDWWDHTCKAIQQAIAQAGIAGTEIHSIGISYQMHGLVLVDKNQQVLRPSIIWCDSRAVDIGNQAFDALGHSFCLKHYLNSPGNFTASKLKWVKDHEPELYEQIAHIMLPGDYIAMRMTGEVNTTISGLSEGILWDFPAHKVAHSLLDHYGMEAGFMPEILPSISHQGELKPEAAEQLGLKAGTVVGYRAGDQMNNALSLGVLHPGEVAATGGTSGVIYGVIDEYQYDEQSRVNGFAHINHTEQQKRIGILLCINGAGIQYAWLKNQVAQQGITYGDMEEMVSKIPVGSDGLRILPFGNGAERMLNNIHTGARINNLQFNRHTSAHLYRAALEGIAFSFVYGFQMMKHLGVQPSVIKAGNDNLFQSSAFSQTVVNLLDTTIQLVDTSGAVGAAKAAGVAVGAYSTPEAATQTQAVVQTFVPQAKGGSSLQAYEAWEQDLAQLITDHSNN